MAARAPSAFSFQHAIAPRRPILAATMDELVDDQHLSLLQNDVVLIDPLILESTMAGVWQSFSIPTYKAVHDWCGYSATRACLASMRCADTTAAANFDIAFNIAGTRYSSTVSASQNSMIWRPWFAAQINSDGSENDIFLEVNGTSGHGIAITGIIIVTNT